MRTLTTLLLLLVAALPGCGGNAAQVSAGIHDALNSVTDYADPAYGLAVTSCHQAESLAVAVNDDAQTARDTIGQIRLRCDRIFASFQAVAAKQAVIRELANALQDGRIQTVELLAAVDELRELRQSSTDLIAAFRRDYDPGINATEGE